MAIWWVATTGSDSNPGTQALPFLTIQRGCESAAPGDTVNVQDGVYADNPATPNKLVQLFTTVQAGLSNQPITLRSVNKYGAQLIAPSTPTGQNAAINVTKSYWIIDGFDISGAQGQNASNNGMVVQASANTGTIVRNCRIHNIGDTLCSSTTLGFSGIYITHANSTLIEDCIFYTIGRLRGNIGENGCSLTPGGFGQAQNDHGLYIDAVNGITVQRCLFYDVTRGWPIHVYSSAGEPSNNLNFYNNTFADKPPTGSSTPNSGHIILAGLLTTVNVKNNLSYDPRLYMLTWSSTTTVVSGVQIDYNFSSAGMVNPNNQPSSGVSIGTHNIANTNPLLTNPATRDYTLQPGSPAINAGTNVGLSFNGSAPDMGAFETLGNIYYVATTGNDSNAGTINSPWLTPQRAIDASQPGDIIYLRGGTYGVGRMNFVTLLKSGTATAPITVSGYPGETVIVAPTNGLRIPVLSSNTNYITFQDMIWDGVNHTFTDGGSQGNLNAGNLIQNAHHITFLRMEIKNWIYNGLYFESNNVLVKQCIIHDQRTHPTVPCTPGTRYYGIYFHNGSGVLEENIIYNNPGGGIQIYPGSTSFPINGLVVRRNRISYNNICVNQNVGGIIVSSESTGLVQNVEIYNNVIFKNALNRVLGSGSTLQADGIQVAKATTSGVKVWANTIYGNDGWGVFIGFTGNQAQGTVVQSNIAFGNLLGQISNQGAGSIIGPNTTSNPLFVSTTLDDYHLLTGSPAINAGVVIAQVSVDYDGVARGNPPDAGAYEFTGSIPDTTPPAIPTGLAVV